MVIEVDTQAIAAALQVKPVTIRSWANRGHIQPLGRDQRGRTTYDLDQVRRVAQQEPGARRSAYARDTP